nr:ribonuclease H-like domain-containing protein [Tanacetum cinerariifolium]
MAPRAVLIKTGLRPLNTARPVNTAHPKNTVYSARPMSHFSKSAQSTGNPQLKLREKGVIDSGCSRHMTGNMSYLSEYEKIDGGYVAFGGDPKGGKINSNGKISTVKLDFKDVYFVKELKFNLFSVSQMCDKKNSVLFTDSECVVLSPEFKLLDESQVLFKVTRKNNMYIADLKIVAPSGGLTCLFAKATLDESDLCHRRLGHINFKTMNKLDETGGILKDFITGIENLIDHKVKIIRCDNETEFKNKEMNQLCEKKGIKREFSIARTPQQNGVAERKNRTLIKAARTMLANSKLPTTFWAEAVNTTCYVQNRVLVIKHHNKTPYELFIGRTPGLSFMRPFRCHVTIINTLDPLGKFDGKAGEGFFIRISMNSKAFRVFNSRTRIVENTLHITFLEDKPNVARSGPTWLFDIDTLTKSMNYKPVVAGNQSTSSACKARVERVPDKDYILLPLWTQDLLFSSSSKDSPGTGCKPSGEEEKKDDEGPENIDSEDNVVDENIDYGCADDPNMPNLEEIVYLDDDEVGAEADMTNLDTNISISPIPTTRIHKDQQVEQIIRDIHSAPQTIIMIKNVTNLKPKKVIQALTDPSWIEAMQDELLQFKLQQVWTLMDLPNAKRAIGTK